MSSNSPRSKSPTPIPTPDIPGAFTTPNIPGAFTTPNTNGSLDNPRRTSFGFLRRKSSSEHRNPMAPRSVSGSKMSRKEKAAQKEELLRRQREAAAVPKQPPRLPSHNPLPRLTGAFNNENERPDSFAIMSGKHGMDGNGNEPHWGSGRVDNSPPYNVPIPPIPVDSRSPNSHAMGNGNGANHVDPYPTAESMAHRGRYSYASSAVSSLGVNSPRRVRRRKDPTPFNILVIGAKNSGKTSFIDFLSTSLALPSSHSQRQQGSPSPPKTAIHSGHDYSAFKSRYLETEIDHERVGVTLWDSQGLERNIVDLQLKEMADFLESKFEDTFTEEQKVIRAPAALDTHIHAVFLILDPANIDANITSARKTNHSHKLTPSRVLGGLDEDLDLSVLRTLSGKTTVIPVISKADTITTAHMTFLKRTVWDALKAAKLDPLEALDLAEDEDDSESLDERDEDAYFHDHDAAASSEADEGSVNNSSPSSSPASPNRAPPPVPASPSQAHRRSASGISASLSTGTEELPYLPMSIISPDLYEPHIPGRRFPWGFADPYNETHCDFVRLKESVFSEWRAELREASRTRWYEGWRTSRLNRRGRGISASGGRNTSASRGYSARGLSGEGKMRSPSVGAESIGMAVSTNGSPEATRRGRNGGYTY